MSNSQKEIAEAIERERALLRAQAIDIAMEQAGHIYQCLRAIDDPYAMHKAVEALPASVLAHILKEKLDGDLYKNPPEQINNRGPSPIHVSMGYYARHSEFAKYAVKKMARAIMSGPIPTQSKPHDMVINAEIESFLNNHFHKLPGIVPSATNYHLVRLLFDALYGEVGIRPYEYKRGSGATTTVVEWLKWKAPKAIVIQSGIGMRECYKPFASVRSWQSSLRGTKPEIVIIEEHSGFLKTHRSKTAFRHFVKTIPFRGIYLQAYES